MSNISYIDTLDFCHLDNETICSGHRVSTSWYRHKVWNIWFSRKEVISFRINMSMEIRYGFWTLLTPHAPFHSYFLPNCRFSYNSKDISCTPLIFLSIEDYSTSLMTITPFLHMYQFLFIFCAGNHCDWWLLK